MINLVCCVALLGPVSREVKQTPEMLMVVKNDGQPDSK